MYLIDIGKNFNQILRFQFFVDLIHQYQKLENSLLLEIQKSA